MTAFRSHKFSACVILCLGATELRLPACLPACLRDSTPVGLSRKRSAYNIW